MAIARTRRGKARKTSVVRMTASSGQPPKYPASSPTPRLIAMARTRIPTLSEMRAPATIRLRRSRPRSSVPSGWRADGNWSFSSGAMRSGLAGVTAGPTTATRSSAATIEAPTHAAGVRASVRMEWARKLVPDARVDKRIGEIHRQVDQHEHERQQQRGAHDGGVVEGQNPFHAVEAQARPGEDHFHEEHAAQQDADVESHHRDERDQGVAQAVP